MTQNVPIRDAATIIVRRSIAGRAHVLMGQRGAKAVFMPNKVVFPGGAIDAADHVVPLARPIAEPCQTRLTEQAQTLTPNAILAAGIRELWEETGQILGRPGPWEAPPVAWAGFAKAGYRPDPGALRFFFRAITPPGRPRRFDARFFLVDASALVTDPDDFSAASDELSHLRWQPLDDMRNVDLPFITQIVLAELAAHHHDGPPDSVPFYQNSDEDSAFLRLRGRV
ncbi:MAG: NUDIX hydrolase [Pseudomonadota bacterium]